MNIAEVRTAMKARLDTIDGLNVYENGYTGVNPPAALIMFDEIDYWKSMDGTAGRLQFIALAIVVMVGRASDRGALKLLDEFCSSSGPKSVANAVKEDQTLGGAVHHATVTRVNQVGEVKDGENTFLAVEFQAEVYG